MFASMNANRDYGHFTEKSSCLSLILHLSEVVDTEKDQCSAVSRPSTFSYRYYRAGGQVQVELLIKELTCVTVNVK